MNTRTLKSYACLTTPYLQALFPLITDQMISMNPWKVQMSFGNGFHRMQNNCNQLSKISSDSWIYVPRYLRSVWRVCWNPFQWSHCSVNSDVCERAISITNQTKYRYLQTYIQETDALLPEWLQLICIWWNDIWTFHRIIDITDPNGNHFF